MALVTKTNTGGEKKTGKIKKAGDSHGVSRSIKKRERQLETLAVMKENSTSASRETTVPLLPALKNAVEQRVPARNQKKKKEVAAALAHKRRDSH